MAGYRLAVRYHDGHVSHRLLRRIRALPSDPHYHSSPRRGCAVLCGRMQGGWNGDEEQGTGLQTEIAKAYVEHFKKFYCDTACNEFAPKILELAMDFFGSDRTRF